MALTLPRCIAIVIAGWLIALMVLLRPIEELRGREESERLVLARRDRAGQNATNRAAHRLRSMQVRDSVVAVLAKMRHTDSSRAVIGTGLGWREEPARAMVQRLATRRSVSTVAPIDLAVVFDTATRVRGRDIWTSSWQVTHLIPATPGDRCLSMMRVKMERRDEKYWRARFVELSEQELIGPCSFYEAFGPPGREVDRWLRAGAWRFGTVGRWPRPFRALPAARWPQPEFWDSERDRLRRHVSVRAYKCIAGDQASCLGLILNPDHFEFDKYTARIVGNDLLEAGSGWNWNEWDELAYKNDEAWILSDMARMLGPERFRKFWSSDLPPADAFQAATGQGMGAWLAHWSKDVYGERERGPGLEPASAVFAALVILLAIGSAIVSARSHQVA